jgi:hypothetical protein
MESLRSFETLLNYRTALPHTTEDIHSLPMFRVNVLPPSSEPRVSQASDRLCLLFVRCLFGLLFDPENGGSTLTRNIGKLPDYTSQKMKENQRTP